MGKNVCFYFSYLAVVATRTNYAVIKGIVELWHRATQQNSAYLFKLIITKWNEDVALSLYFDFAYIFYSYVVN